MANKKGTIQGTALAVFKTQTNTTIRSQSRFSNPPWIPIIFACGPLILLLINALVNG